MAIAFTWEGFADTNLSFSEQSNCCGPFHAPVPPCLCRADDIRKRVRNVYPRTGIFHQSSRRSPQLLLQAGSSAITIDTTIQAGTWHHLAVVRKSNVFTLYLDGIQTGKTLTAPGSGEPQGNLRMGKDTFNAALDGGGIQFY